MSIQNLDLQQLKTRLLMWNLKREICSYGSVLTGKLFKSHRCTAWLAPPQARQHCSSSTPFSPRSSMYGQDDVPANWPQQPQQHVPGMRLRSASTAGNQASPAARMRVLQRTPYPMVLARMKVRSRHRKMCLYSALQQATVLAAYMEVLWTTRKLLPI
jgi:hypothetical protein